MKKVNIAANVKKVPHAPQMLSHFLLIFTQFLANLSRNFNESRSVLLILHKLTPKNWFILYKIDEIRRTQNLP